MGYIRDIELSVWSEILVVDFIRNIIHSCSVSPLTCNPMIPYDAIFPWLHTLSDRFPVINSLMSRINLRKKRDTLILGAVISGCVVFLLWWVLRWASNGGSADYVNILYRPAALRPTLWCWAVQRYLCGYSKNCSQPYYVAGQRKPFASLLWVLTVCPYFQHFFHKIQNISLVKPFSFDLGCHLLLIGLFET